MWTCLHQIRKTESLLMLNILMCLPLSMRSTMISEVFVYGGQRMTVYTIPIASISLFQNDWNRRTVRAHTIFAHSLCASYREVVLFSGCVLCTATMSDPFLRCKYVSASYHYKLLTEKKNVFANDVQMKHNCRRFFISLFIHTASLQSIININFRAFAMLTIYFCYF